MHYLQRLFEENGYTVPTNKDELLALAAQMQADGLVPFAYANDGKWPVQGTFDILNMRLNGYQFHVDLLAGKEDWTGDKVKAVFALWTDLLPFHQENPNGRTWQEAATALESKEAGMYYLGTFVSSNSTDQEYLDDLDFFNFPELDPAIGADALDAPIDGFMMAASPKNEDGAKAMLTAIGGLDFITAANAVNPSAVPANSKFDSSVFTPIQKKSAELVGAAKNIAQFLDRDTSPDFVSNVISDAFANAILDELHEIYVLRGVLEQAALASAVDAATCGPEAATPPLSSALVDVPADQGGRTIMFAPWPKPLTASAHWWWPTTPSCRQPCKPRSRSAPTSCCTPPPSTSTATATWSAVRWWPLMPGCTSNWLGGPTRWA